MPADPFAAQHDAIADLRGRQLFFIGGMPKSGTTWLQLLLDAHPGISCRGEGHFCNRFQPPLLEAVRRYNATINTKTSTIFRDIGGYSGLSESHTRYLLASAIALQMADGAGDAPIVGEKTPDNVLSFRQLRDMFPAARFVLALRDGRDCAVSAWYHNLRINPEGARSRFPRFVDFVDAFARAWAACIDTGLGFTEAHPDICITVTYETLLRQSDVELTRLLAFLGADTAAATVRHCVAAADFTRLTGGRPPGQEDRLSLFRLGIVGDRQRHFDPESSALFDRLAGAQLRRCGYADLVADERRVASG